MDFDVIVSNSELFSVGVASSSTLILGFIIFLNNKRSITNRTFFVFSIITTAWGIINYLGNNVFNESALWFMRMSIFLAVWQAFYLFQLFYVFPKEKIEFSKIYKRLLRPLVFFTSILNLTPLVFKQVTRISEEGRIIGLSNGPGILLFGTLSVGLVIAAMVLLIKRIITSNKEERKPLVVIMVGTLITFALIIVFNFIFPAFKGDAGYVNLGSVFLLPFVIFNSYAIVKHKVLNIKIISTEFLIFGLLMAMLFEFISSENLVTLVYKGSLFLLVLSIGILLIRSVRAEVQQREKVTNMAKSLETANLRLQELDRQKTEFLSIASHQLRTPMSIIKGYIELIQDGAYGKVTKKTFDILADMDETNERLVKLIDEFLDVSRIEQGRTKFSFAMYDMNELINSVVKELSQRATDKSLKIKWKPEKRKAEVCMDEEKVRHVVFNFIDNAIKYSKKGAITVSLEKLDDGLNVKVKDNGIGFDKVDEANFFQKFYRGRNVKLTDAGGTGLGIYVTKKFIEKHDGKVWAKSDGLGKGGEFGFWIPFNLDKLNVVETDEESNGEVK